jgi:hypothetical protein
VVGERRILAIASAALLALAASPSTAARAAKPSFSHPTRINNHWFPLRSGTKLVYTGSEFFGKRRVNHRVVFIVTDLVKVIDGVRTVVVWDRDFNSGKLLEGELAFDAQDDSGTVWLFGEYPEEYSHGKLTGAPDTWISGIARARRGIAMQANPRTGTPSYSQGLAPKIGFADRAKVYLTGQRNCVPAGCYTDVLVNQEWSPSEPHQRQFKYYAPRIGNIRVGFSGGGQREDLVLRTVAHLSHRAMASVDAAALEADRRGPQVSKVYARTSPATIRPPLTGVQRLVNSVH